MIKIRRHEFVVDVSNYNPEGKKPTIEKYWLLTINDTSATPGLWWTWISKEPIFTFKHTFLRKRTTMSDVTQTPGLVPEDQISAQMAAAVGYPATQEAQSEEIGEIRKRFVQTADMISGEPVVI